MKRYIFLSLTILCVIFIFCNSLMSANISSVQSSFVLKLIQKTAEAVRLSPALITEHMVRKLAHFCEYALLGLLATITTWVWHGRFKNHIFKILFLGLFVPVTDEFLQLFIESRAGLVQDIVLDFIGFVAGTAFYLVIRSLSRNCGN